MLDDHELFKRAMSCFPTGVTLVTTTDADERNWGFTANAFSSLSLDPPLVLVCLSKEADCCSAFISARKFGVNILRREHESLARRFATKGDDKFAGGEFRKGNLGVPILPDAVAILECAIDALVPGGAHVILIGLVEHAKVQDGYAAIYFQSAFHSLTQPRTIGLAANPATSWTQGGGLDFLTDVDAYRLA
jgi:flavin reductase ActVB